MTRDSGGTSERAVDYAVACPEARRDGLNRVRTETQYPNWPLTTGPLVMTTTVACPDAGGNLNGNRATVTDQLSRTTSYSYDRLNRLTKIDYSDSGTPDVGYTYDANGSRLMMVDGTGTTTYSAACPEERRDELGRLLAVTTPASPSNKTVGYRYDLDGNRTKLLYPNSEAVTYAFDKASRLTTLTDWASRVTSYAYYPDGALQTQTNPNGTVATYAYDNARRLLDVWNQKPGTTPETITRHQFTMDAVGNRTQVAETLAPVLPPAPVGTPSALPTGHLVGATPTGTPAASRPAIWSAQRPPPRLSHSRTAPASRPPPERSSTTTTGSTA